MEESGIRLISKEMIKPSSPTPHPLRNYSLSFLDQISPPIYCSFVFFYRSSDAKPMKSDLLKCSLSRVLSLYYPLAGRIQTNDQNATVVVHCNDGGVLYQEAEASCRLDDLLLDQKKTGLYDRLLNRLVPLQPVDQGPLLGVQFNTFRCGGVAVSISMSHKLADGWSIVWFLKTWADIARGDDRADTILSPELIGSELFPPREILGFDPAEWSEKKKLVTRRFLFRKESIASLRKNYTEKNETSTDRNEVLVPSKVQTLTAFIWRRFRAATKSTTSNSDNVGAIVQTVNLRTRMEPQLPNNSFGNYYRFTITTPNDHSNLISPMRDSIAKIDHNYIKDLQQGTQHLNMLIQGARQQQLATTIETKDHHHDHLSFSSLCGFPFYEVDFGCGKPAKAGHPRLGSTNLVTLVPTSESGDEIEAVVTLGEDDMAKFRVDGELLRYASSSFGEFVGQGY